MGDFLSAKELMELQLGACGESVRISRRALILSPERVHIGSNSRIDAFCVISGSSKGVFIGSHVHMSAYVSILGADRVTIEDFCTVSVRCSLFTSNDDYLGFGLTNPTVPERYREVVNGPIHLKEHCIIGCGSIILPNVRIGRSAAVGALSLIKSDVDDFAIVAGVPMRRIGTRRAEHLGKADALLRDRTSR
jgi:dTDP-4-amino-4,6-dideoxy-D-glucose acyltransferase